MSIASYIKDDLTIRLKTGQELPSQLTLDSLAEMYQVSFTPVRTAVAELIEAGLLTKGPNRRLVAAQAISLNEESPEPSISLPELPPDPFDVIADDLIRLSLEGKPVYLREEATAEKYGYSRSMIRNVLHRLAGEGILDHIPRRGWRLRPFRQCDLQSYIEVRVSLEITALELAFPRLETRKLQQILQWNAFPAPDVETLKINESLHDYLIETSGNAYVKEFFQRHGRYYQLLFQWEDHDRAAAMETIRQHREILSALLTGDLPRAKKALSHHILNNHPILNPERTAGRKLTEEQSDVVLGQRAMT